MWLLWEDDDGGRGFTAHLAQVAEANVVIYRYDNVMSPIRGISALSDPTITVLSVIIRSVGAAKNNLHVIV